MSYGRKRVPGWIWLLVLVAMLGGGAGGAVAALWDMPEVKALEEYRPSTVTRLYAASGEVFSEFYQERRIMVSLSKIPKDLKEAILAVEDARFYRHHGIDLIGIARAMVKNLMARRIVEGGSTITQQLTKVLFLTPERSLSRKLKEAVLAVMIESRYTKDEILELYCNQVYMGSGAYGVEAAAQTYFGKSVSRLTLPEAALLAGLPKAPTRFSPFNNREQARARMLQVLERMVEAGFITPEEARKAATTRLKFNSSPSRDMVEAAYFAEYVRQHLEEKYGSQALYRGGLKVYTTLDLKTQRAAYQALRQGLREIGQSRRNTPDPDLAIYPGVDLRGLILKAASQQSLRVAQGGAASPWVEGALLAIEPQTGYIRAMVGGYDFSRSQFNRAVQARRQPGSAFKPFIYLTAIAEGFTPADIILDAPVSYAGASGEWSPKNFTNKYYGPNTLRRALEFSRNVSTVRLLDKVGIRPVVRMAHQMGISSPLGLNLSLALGTSEVTLLELTSAYAVLANLGTRVEPAAIRYITDSFGKILERHHPQTTEVLRPEVAYVVTHMLKGVVWHGTGQRALALGRPAAAKTGTTNDYQDAWFIGYTPQLVTGIWVGYDDHRSLRGTGGRLSAPIWVRFMKAALAGRPVRDFPPPANITWAEIDPSTGLLATPACPHRFSEAFIKGTQPTRLCYHGVGGGPPAEELEGISEGVPLPSEEEAPDKAEDPSPLEGEHL
ncbi:MAG: PBP1A family penicillin-binding protein [Candidatus Tectomicrobia bacterium]|uniref:peptidoglycan glycosyltransferase n=1 Tax=Tectimicrobiota bacterium TaxID=2528274 RepID=A0A932CRF0_UNCTE|nr:PBP1A family penicillin-binding protein [Candidatus Tectomicrobia bacterium]